MPRDLETIVEEIRYHHRQRVFAMEQRKRADLAVGAFLRVQLGWRKDGEKSANDFARKRAGEMIALGEKLVREAAKSEDKRKPVDGRDAADFIEWEPVIVASVMARAPFDKVEANAEKSMGKLAAELPVWPWAEAIRGFGAVGLAVIVGEAGDLSRYDNPGKLWSRMGLALKPNDKGEMVRQGGLAKSASKDAWIAHGYNRMRRSRMFTIGDSLLKGNADGEYRSLYLERKEYERAKAEAEGLTVAPAAKIPAKRAAEFRSDGHIHRRAQRYMEKRLLRDLWRAWREANVTTSSAEGLPSADLIAAE